MHISLRLRGVLLGHTLKVGILPNGALALVLKLRSIDESNLLKPKADIPCGLPDFERERDEPNELLELMGLNPTTQRQLLTHLAPNQGKPLPRARHFAETPVVFPCTPQNEGPIYYFLTRFLCQHWVVIDGFAIEHNIDYSKVAVRATNWVIGKEHPWAPETEQKQIYRDRHGLALLVRAITLSPLDKSFNSQQNYLYFGPRGCVVRPLRPKAQMALGNALLLRGTSCPQGASCSPSASWAPGASWARGASFELPLCAYVERYWAADFAQTCAELNLRH